LTSEGHDTGRISTGKGRIALSEKLLSPLARLSVSDFPPGFTRHGTDSIAEALGPVYQDRPFAELFPGRGQPAEARYSTKRAIEWVDYKVPLTEICDETTPPLLQRRDPSSEDTG
jgi:hypothetical protein